MLLKRFYDEGLAQASYLIGCGATGEAIVIDPNRDIRQYVDAARAEQMRIKQVTETHIHADFVSGSRELARATGATLLLSAEGGSDWQYGFAASDRATLLRDGDVLRVGNVRLEVLHTPGHTPEHLSFVVTDTAVATEPMGIVSGDFVFVGDVGRPDLLEKAANVANTMEAGAKQLFRSLERFRALPEWVQVWPGHGAGSACGKSLGAVPSSTIGYEKRFNWGVGTTSEAEFVAAVLDGQPEPPPYFAEMKRVNRDGPAVLGALPTPARAPMEALATALAAGAMVVDTRPAAQFAAGHVPGTISIPLGKSFINRAGWLVPSAAKLHLVANGEPAMQRATRELSMIGLDHVTAWHEAAVVEEWKTAGKPVGTVASTDVGALASRLAAGSVTVIDVRERSEWEEGHLPGAIHIPLGTVGARAAEIPRDRPIVLHCQGGGRSAIATSVLQKLGLTGLENLRGGFDDWQRAGHPVVRGDPPAGE